MKNLSELKTAYDYDDVTLIPQYSELKSRSLTDVSSKGYGLPIMASCMDSLGNPKMVELFAKEKIPFVFHRAFKSAKEQFLSLFPEYPSLSYKNEKEMYKYVWFAVGSVQKYKDWINELYETYKVRNFCVDMAHGDSKACVDTIKYIKSLSHIYGNGNDKVHVIAGNVATASGFKRLQNAGADGIRVGIASGQICFTPTTKVWYISPSRKVYQKEIQHIQIGDSVLTASGKIRKVTNKFINDYNGEMYQVGNDIVATPTHKFRVFDHNTNEKIFLEIKDYDENRYSFLNVENHTEKSNIDLIEYSGKVYNIEVEDEHTYLVGNLRLGVSNCSTNLQTGFGVPILTSIIDCAKVKKNAWLIADGGCKYTGDIAKAIYFGADFVMLGKMLASTDLASSRCYNEKQELIPEGYEIFENPESESDIPYVVKYRGYRGMACYSKDTEVLTKNGWKYFYELNNDDEIATLNKDTYKLEYHKYLNFFEYDFNGNMYLIKDNFIDLLITPNHNVFTKGRYKNSQYTLEQIDFIANKRKQSIFKKDCCWEGKKINSFTLPNSDITFPMNDWLYFYGFWIAEGCTYKTKQKIKYDVFCTSFSNNNKELIDKCVKILNNAGINTKIRKRKNNYEVISYNRYLYNYLSSFGKSIDKYIDPVFLELCSESLNYILQGIYDGDGCKKRKSIYTVSKKLLDNISEICLKTNRTPKISFSRKNIYNYKKFKRNYVLYSINISDYAHEHIVNMEKNCMLSNYNDKVYCIEVPNNVIYVRRNNKMCWCGNSRDARSGILSYASVEGVSGLTKYTGTTEQFIIDTKLRLQASLSYGGSNNWTDFRKKVKAIRRSQSGIIASNTHLDKTFDR